MTGDLQDRAQLGEGDLTREIIGGFYDCYNELGSGFLESVYRRSLAVELRLRGLSVVEEAVVEAVYKGVEVGVHRMDMLVSGRVIIEVKATAVLGPSDKRQVLNYLRASELEVGLLLHFGPVPKIHRLTSTKPFERAFWHCAPQQTDPAVTASSQ